MKTQQEINELADAYYDGMANVMDRFDQINKVDETKKYIMARFGRLPEDDEVSELIVEYKTLEVHKSKTIESFFFKLFTKFGHATIGTFWTTCQTGIATMQDQPMMRLVD